MGRSRYRQHLYDHYVSERVSLAGAPLTQTDYERWAVAARHRLRGWLPAALDTPVLDMGCGAGQCLYLLGQLGYTDVTGVDLSLEQVAQARQWCPPAALIHDDVRAVLADNPARFGLITGFDLIEHFGKDEQMPFIEAVCRALRPGGRLVLQTPNAESPWFGAVAYGDYTHEWFFTPHSLGRWLHLFGLDDYDARACGPYGHGLPSGARFLAWKLIAALWRLYNLVETGTAGSGIYTRVFVATAVKPLSGAARP